MSNTTDTTKKNTRPDTAAPKVSRKSKEATASSVTTGLILRLLAFVYGIKHVHIQHRRETVLKMVPHLDTNGVQVQSIKNGGLFVLQKQFRGKGGRTTASVTLPNGLRIQAVAITNNQSKFVKSVGYNQAVLNLWNAIEANSLLHPQVTSIPAPEPTPAPSPLPVS